MTMKSPMAKSTQALVHARTCAEWSIIHGICLGPQTDRGWMYDLDLEDLELTVTADHAMVLVDRAPMRVAANGATSLRQVIRAIGGMGLELVGEVRHLNDSILCGTYLGEYCGTPVKMEQYVRDRNGVVQMVVLVVERRNGARTWRRVVHSQAALVIFTRDVGPGSVVGESDPVMAKS